ncbi:MAG: hypothetical protein JXR07_20605 [Reichenbachiella sp.]
MKDASKTALRKALLSFFRQRKYAAKMMKDTMMQSYAESLTIKFNLIQNFDYWRHCFEVVKQKDLIMKILPSRYGHHAKIRLAVEKIIYRSMIVTRVSRHEHIRRQEAQEAQEKNYFGHSRALQIR